MQLQLVSTQRRHERRARFIDYHRSGSPDLRDRLVRRHLPLARRLARRYARRGVPADDLFQVASIGLIHAVDRYDPRRGIPFDVYATPTILGEIKHHFRDRAWDLRVPRGVQDRYLAVNVAIEGLNAQLGRAPSISELARSLGAADEEIVEAIEAGGAYNARPIIETGSATGALVQGVESECLLVDDPRFAATEDRLVITELIADLEPREQLIVRLYYWKGMSQDAIAARLGISQMHVSRLLRRSIARLHDLLESDRPQADH